MGILTTLFKRVFAISADGRFWGGSAPTRESPEKAELLETRLLWITARVRKHGDNFTLGVATRRCENGTAMPEGQGRLPMFHSLFLRVTGGLVP
jgi:hypothetical protein